MSDTWTFEPRKMPHRCRRSGRHAPVDGPYFEDSVPYSESGGDDRTLTQYISVGWLKAIAAAPGSPVVVLTHDEHAELEARADSAEAERDEALIALEELRAQEPQTIVSPIDVQALADNLVVPLEGYFQRRTGPKPKRAA
jgi:hypothetical protein